MKMHTQAMPAGYMGYAGGQGKMNKKGKMSKFKMEIAALSLFVLSKFYTYIICRNSMYLISQRSLRVIRG